MGWTDEQQLVIDTRNSNILVSAAAGSGKTAVLVERIIKKITDSKNPIDVDKLLVVTFTRAAAAEMRERIYSALYKAASQNPDDEHIAKQLMFIHNANIMTIDSFCNMVLKDNFNLAGVDPNFRTADESELALIKQDVISELLEEKYEEGNEEFLSFVENRASGKNDENLDSMILNIYEFAMSNVEPQEWFDRCISNYDTTNGLMSLEWYKDVIENSKKVVNKANEIINTILDTIPEGEKFEKQIDGYSLDKSSIEMALKYEDINDMIRKIKAIKFVNFNKHKAGTKLSQEQDEAKKICDNLRAEYRKIIQDIQDTLPDTEEQVLEELNQEIKIISMMIDIAKEFKTRYFEAKKERNIYDFNDIVHLVYGILKGPSKVAIEMAEKYDEIMIDEYQDSNYLQEALLTTISGEYEGRHNMFMVGDIKQSIYKFRLAKPEIFLGKYKKYARITGKDLTEEEKKINKTKDSVRIDLAANFRSRVQVVNAINDIFRNIMGEEFGGIEYDENQQLNKVGDPIPENETNDYSTELILIDGQKTEMGDEYEDIKREEIEARLIAKRIKELMNDDKFMVLDKETKEFRKLAYRDIAILHRSAKTDAKTYKKIIESCGVPVIIEQGGDFFETYEIRNIVALLRSIDNPLQDIPLAAAMRNIYGFTTRELAIIKADNKKELLYNAIRLFLEKDVSMEGTIKDIETLYNKTRYFYNSLNSYRDKAVYTSMSDFINLILKDTNFEERVTAMPAGERRLANIELLKNKANDYEKTSFSGLFNFVRYVELIKKTETKQEEAVITANLDAVSYMSIHKSKGLEYPVVFVTSLEKMFNTKDSAKAEVVHQDYGIGIDYIDVKRRVKWRSLIKKYIAEQLKKEAKEEELRVLYVALTRAREKLILIGFNEKMKNKLDKMSKKAYSGGDYLGAFNVSESSNYLDWVLMAANNTGIKDFKIFNENVESILSDVLEEGITELESKNNLVNAIKRIEEITTPETFLYNYPYIKETSMYSKYSVSDLKKRSMDELADDEEQIKLYEKSHTEVSYVPEFINKKETLFGAARGTAYHRVFELLDYNKSLVTVEDIKNQLDSMREQAYITEEMYGAINPVKILNFAKSELGLRMQKASDNGTLRREQQYVMAVPANMVDTAYEGDAKVLVQGIIDAFFEEDGKVIIVDYKTDNVEKIENLETLYGVQLDYYKYAIERVTGKEVSQKIIYSVKFDEQLFLK